MARPLPEAAAGVLTVLLLAAELPAQIVMAIPRADSVARRFAKHLTEVAGQQAIVGQPESGLRLDEDTPSATGADVRLLVARGGEPGRVSGRGQVRVATTGLSLPAVSFWFVYLDRHQTLEGLALEYAQREALVESLRASRDAEEKGSRAWSGWQGRLIAARERLHAWLMAFGYGRAASKLERELVKDRALVAGEARAIRRAEALQSVREAPLPDEFRAALEAVGGGASFLAVESTHLRLLFPAGVPAREALGAIEVGEKIIDAFRAEFVDPYLDTEFPDHIPDARFGEFLFAPAAGRLNIRLFSEYYGVDADRDDRAHDLGGRWFRRSHGDAEFVVTWPVAADRTRDFEAVVAHRLGHMLAVLHYHGGEWTRPPAWIEEAVGYYVSLEHLGRNIVTCFKFEESKYAEDGRAAEDKTVDLGLKARFNRLAIDHGPRLDALAAKSLARFRDADLAKSWSLFDFVARRTGRDGQLWLRALCRASMAGDDAAMIDDWRASSERLFGVASGTDVFAVLEERWLDYARTEQCPAGGAR